MVPTQPRLVNISSSPFFLIKERSQTVFGRGRSSVATNYKKWCFSFSTHVIVFSRFRFFFKSSSPLCRHKKKEEKVPSYCVFCSLLISLWHRLVFGRRKQTANGEAVKINSSRLMSLIAVGLIR